MSLADVLPLHTLAIVVLGTLVVSGCGVSTALDDTTRRVEEQTVSADGVSELRIVTENGPVVVRGADVQQIAIRTVLRESNPGDASSHVATGDDGLMLTGACDSRWWNQCSVEYEVTVPDRIDVTVVVDNGSITLDDLRGDVDVTTDNGAIEAGGMAVGTFLGATDNGRILLDFLAAPGQIDARSDNGGITVVVPRADTTYVVDATTDRGHVDIEIEHRDDAEHRMTLRSDNGSVDVLYPDT